MKPWWVVCQINDRTIYVPSQYFYEAQQRAKWYMKQDLDKHVEQHDQFQEETCQVCLAHFIRNKKITWKHISDEDHKKLINISSQYDHLEQEVRKLEKKIKKAEEARDLTLKDDIVVEWEYHHSSTSVRFNVSIRNIEETIRFDFMRGADTVDKIVNDMLKDLPVIPEKYRIPLKQCIGKKLAEFERINNNKKPAEPKNITLLISTQRGNILWKMDLENNVDTLSEFKKMMGNEITNDRGNLITVTEDGMLGYLIGEWRYMKTNIKENDDDCATSLAQIMWNKIPSDLRYDWLQILNSDELFQFYSVASPKIRDELECMNISVDLIGPEHDQVISGWWNTSSWGQSLWDQNPTPNWHVLNQAGDYVDEEKAMDNAVMQSLLDSNPNLAQLQINENYYQAATYASEMFGDAKNSWEQHLKKQTDEVPVNDISHIREL